MNFIKNLFAFAFVILPQILPAQNVGIGTTTPLARLHVTDSSVLFSAPGFSPPSIGDPPVSGEGRRMMWYADKAAFRAGYVNTTNWDKDSIGSFSLAAGYDSKALGNYSIAMGPLAFATGLYSVSIGGITKASGTSATAFGWATQAGGSYSTSMGSNTTAGGYAATSIGHYSNANAEYSQAFGESVTANSWISTALGRHNDPIVTTPTTSWVATEPLLIVGNGQGPGSPAPISNAMVILKNGNTGIGINNPGEKLQVNGNVKADDFKYTAPKTFVYTIPGAAFQPESSRDTFSLSLGSGAVSMYSELNGKRLMAPVQLPHNAVMQTLTIYISYNASANIQALLYRKTITSNFFPDNIGFITSSGSTGAVIPYSTPVNSVAASNVVDNNLYTYYISAGSTGNWAGGIMELRAVIITYTMAAPQ